MPPAAPIVTRFAPSPTGLLHLGHAFSAWFAWHAAQKAGGRFLLRLEDIDRNRCRPEFEAAILEDLAWLGLAWETPVRRQSDHFPDYRRALGQLDARGLIYPCFCTRADIATEINNADAAPHGPDGPVYPGTCRHLSWEEAEERKDKGEQRVQAAAFGDVVLARKDTPTSYHLAVTVDDAIQGVTLVTRGEDLFAATHIHRLLQALLDLPVPQYRHHGLLTDADGRRFAKRDKALTLRALREAGTSPPEVWAMAGVKPEHRP